MPEAYNPANKGTGVWVGLDSAVDGVGGRGGFLPPLRLVDIFISSAALLGSAWHRSELFDPFFAGGATAIEVAQEDEVTQALFAPAALKRARQMEGRATFELAVRFHFSFS